MKNIYIYHKIKIKLGNNLYLTELLISNFLTNFSI